MQAQSQVETKLLLEMYRTMYLSRRMDDKEIQLKGQNKIFFQISGDDLEIVRVLHERRDFPAAFTKDNG